MWITLGLLCSLSGDEGCSKEPLRAEPLAAAEPDPVLDLGPPVWMGPPAPPPDEAAPEITFLAPTPYARVTRHGGAVAIGLTVADVGRGLAAIEVAGRAYPVMRGESVVLVGVALPVRPGLAAIPIVARDVVGHESRRLLSLMVADAWHEDGASPAAALGVRVASRALAEGGLARLITSQLLGFQVGDHLPDPVARGLGHDLALEHVAHGPPLCVLEPREDALHVALVVPNLTAELAMRGVLSARGPVRASGLGIDLDILTALADGRLALVPSLPVVSVVGLQVGMPYDLDHLLEPAMESRIRGRVHAALSERLPELASQAVEALTTRRRVVFEAGGASTGMPQVALDLELVPQAVLLQPGEIRADLGARLSAPFGAATPGTVPDISSCDRGAASFSRPLGVSVPSGLLNQLAAAWFEAGGFRATLPARPGAGLPAPLEIELRLPPRVEGCGPTLRVQLAGVRMKTRLTILGAPIEVAGELALDLDVLPRATSEGSLALDLSIVPGSVASDQPALAALLGAWSGRVETLLLPPVPEVAGLRPRIEDATVAGTGLELGLSVP